MSTENVSNYYMGSFIGSLIGGLMILLFDFAAWDGSNYYLGVSEYGWVGLTAGPLAFLIIAPIGTGLLYVAYNSYNATKEPPTQEKLDLMYRISRTALIAILAGGLIFAIEASDAYWWFEAGFYGGAIGSVISILTLRLARESAAK